MQPALALEAPSRRPLSNQHLTYHFVMWLPLLLYIGLSFLLWQPFRHLMYKDEINLITIAERYARGDWTTAPNSFWPPLISWLQAMFIRAGLDGPASAKVVSVLTGVIAYGSFQRLLLVYEAGPMLRLWASLLMVPSLLYFAFFAAGADLLLMALLGFYFGIVLRQPLDQATTRQAAICGVLGALAFFCKGYALYFFIAHLAMLTIWNGGRLARGIEVKQRLRKAALACAVAAVLIAPWTLALYKKYGIVTLGVIGKYNHAMRGPEVSGLPPALYVGLVKPPPSATVSVWEEPYYLLGMLKSWSPLESKGALIHQLRLMKKNAGVVLSAFQDFSSVWTAIILSGFCSGWRGRRTLSRYNWGLCLAVFHSFQWAIF